MASSVKSIGKFQQKHITFLSEDIETISKLYEFDDWIKYTAHNFAEDIRNKGTVKPVMEIETTNVPDTKSLIDLVFEFANAYLSKDKNWDKYVQQGCIFKQFQCEAIYKMVAETGRMCSLNSVTQILKDFKL